MNFSIQSCLGELEKYPGVNDMFNVDALAGIGAPAGVGGGKSPPPDEPGGGGMYAQ